MEINQADAAPDAYHLEYLSVHRKSGSFVSIKTTIIIHKDINRSLEPLKQEFGSMEKRVLRPYRLNNVELKAQNQIHSEKNSLLIRKQKKETTTNQSRREDASNLRKTPL